MASILEGIYYHHKVSFQFVKVLSNLLEEEGLMRDAYIEEVKVSAKRFAKGIQDSVTVAPLLRTYLEMAGPYGRQDRNTGALAASILASALFVGSALMLPYNTYFSYRGGGCRRAEEALGFVPPDTGRDAKAARIWVR
jgi:hypothetical protein